MIEIQCSSCHTRYRIDERVLPADTPTFKCSRCGHVFTADPLAAKKIAPDSSTKPIAPRALSPRNPKPAVAPATTSKPEAASEPPKEVASETEAAQPQSAFSPDPKPSPIKPYIRNPRPTVFDRNPEPPAPKPTPPPSSGVDSDAVERMKASVEASNPDAALEAPPPAPAPKLSRKEENTEVDDEGENLEFDFSDERKPTFDAEPADDEIEDDVTTSPQQWSVGEDTVDTPPPRSSGFGSGALDPEFSRREPAPIGRGTIPQYAAIAPIQASDALPDEQAYVERTKMHTARSFIGLFLGIAAVFLVFTGIIHGIPSASAELLRRMPVIGPEFEPAPTLENLASISDVQSSYQTVKGGQQALVVAGAVKNHSTVTFHTVQIAVRLLDADQHDLANSAVYCGTTLSPRMIGEMTPHELDFLQKLQPQKSFALEPGHSAPFLMVFIDPPRNVAHLSVAVSKAQPPMTAMAAPASAQP